MAKTKKGDMFTCDVCGLIVTVDEACGCATEEIICCDIPMTKGKAAANKARKKMAAASAPAPAKKAAPRKTGRKVAAKKTMKKAAVKKPARKPAARKR
jgi:hypothetical protein